MVTGERKRLNIALQGGGAHGAFSWGVLDRILEDDRLAIAAISGTSAGAMNAAALADGFTAGGPAEARARLDEFWRHVSSEARHSPVQRSPFDIVMGNWTLRHSVGYHMVNALARMVSPYELNPMGMNPLRDVLTGCVDFERVRACDAFRLYISATNVETGRVKVFDRRQLTADMVMASACLPYMFQAVEIDGAPYWDGGYMGNPALFPFYEAGTADDIMVVQINPVTRPGAPRKAHQINNRINEITFNSSLLKELRAIDFVARLIDEGKLSPDDYRRFRVHIIGSEALTRLGASSKMNAEWAFLTHLRDLGRETAATWLQAHYDDLGARSTVDLRAMFGSIGPQHHG